MIVKIGCWEFAMNINSGFMIILNIAESFFTTWAFMKAGRMEPGNILTGVIFILSFFLYRHISIRLDRKPFVYTPGARKAAVVLAFLYTLFYMTVSLYDSISYCCCCFLTVQIRIRWRNFFIRRKMHGSSGTFPFIVSQAA